MLASPAVAQTYFIDFEDASVVEGAILSSQYLSAYGVSFSPGGLTGPGQTPGIGYATNTDMTITNFDLGALGGQPSGRMLHALGAPNPAPGSIYYQQGRGWQNENGDAVFTALFNNPLSSFSADFRGVGIGSVEAPHSRLLAFDAAGALLTTTTAVAQFNVSTQRLTVVSGGNPIAKVIVNPGDYGDWVGIDNLEFTLAATASKWNVNASGNWSNPANWSAGVPNGPSAVARFESVTVTQPRTITVNIPVTLDKLIVQGSASLYAIDGPGPITFAGPSADAMTITGEPTITTPVTFNKSAIISGGGRSRFQNITASAGTTLTLGNIWMLSNAMTADAISISAGSTLTHDGPTAGKCNSLTIASGGKLDLVSGFVVDFSSTDPTTLIRSYLQTGRITHAESASDQKVIGHVLASELGSSSFLGQAVDGTTVLLRATFAADTDLSGKVDFVDLLRIAQHFQTLATTSWFDGDSDYDGDVDFTDLLALAQNYGRMLSRDGAVRLDSSLASRFASDWQTARAMVPEPALAGMLTLLAVVGQRRRR